MKKEKVLAIPSRVVQKGNMIGNIWFDVSPYLKMIGHKETAFIDREKAETDKSFKQVIPYVVILKGDKIFVTTRSSSSGDKRLRSKISIGVGGHVNRDDYVATLNPAPKMQAFIRGACREVNEEVRISNVSGPVSGRFVAVIDDNSTDVGQVHIGMIAAISVPAKARVEITGDGLSQGSFELPSSIAPGSNGRFEALENWSKIIARNMDAFLQVHTALLNYEPDFLV
jgi:predicted NUDIX family phosphoesterase